MIDLIRRFKLVYIGTLVLFMVFQVIIGVTQFINCMGNGGYDFFSAIYKIIPYIMITILCFITLVGISLKMPTLEKGGLIATATLTPFFMLSYYGVPILSIIAAALLVVGFAAILFGHSTANGMIVIGGAGLYSIAIILLCIICLTLASGYYFVYYISELLIIPTVGIGSVCTLNE